MKIINRIILQINAMEEMEDTSGIRRYTHVVVDMLYDFIDGSWLAPMLKKQWRRVSNILMHIRVKRFSMCWTIIRRITVRLKIMGYLAGTLRPKDTRR